MAEEATTKTVVCTITGEDVELTKDQYKGYTAAYDSIGKFKTNFAKPEALKDYRTFVKRHGSLDAVQKTLDNKPVLTGSTAAEAASIDTPSQEDLHRAHAIRTLEQDLTRIWMNFKLYRGAKDQHAIANMSSAIKERLLEDHIPESATRIAFRTEPRQTEDGMSIQVPVECHGLTITLPFTNEVINVRLEPAPVQAVQSAADQTYIS